MDLSEWFRRKKLKTTAEQARELGISTVTIWRIVKRGVVPSVRIIKQIQERTDGKVRYDDLAGGA